MRSVYNLMMKRTPRLLAVVLLLLLQLFIVLLLFSTFGCEARGHGTRYVHGRAIGRYGRPPVSKRKLLDSVSSDPDDHPVDFHSHEYWQPFVAGEHEDGDDNEHDDELEGLLFSGAAGDEYDDYGDYDGDDDDDDVDTEFWRAIDYLVTTGLAVVQTLLTGTSPR